MKLFWLIVTVFFMFHLFAVEFHVSYFVNEVILNDMDDDGDIDLIVGSTISDDSNEINIFINNGNGEFGGVGLCIDDNIFNSVCDMDNDNLKDLVTRTQPGLNLGYYRNLSNFTFSEPVIIPLEETYMFQKFLYADLDADSDIDVVLDHCGDNSTCNMLINDGNGFFTEENCFIAYDRILDLKITNTNQDQYPDVAATIDDFGATIYFNNNLEFEPVIIDSTQWFNIWIRDMNGDLVDDIILNDNGLGDTKIWYNDGNGIFSNYDLITTSLSHIREIADLNNDGFPDFLVQRSYPAYIYYYFNSGHGNLDGPHSYTEESVNSYHIRSADLDGNGYNDLVIVGYHHYGVNYGMHILFNDGTGNFLEEPQVSSNDFVQTNNIMTINNYPNPFNPSTTIVFNVDHQINGYNVDLNLGIYDVKGQKIVQFSQPEIQYISSKKQYIVIWDGNDDFGRPLASGLYFCRALWEGQSFTKKILLLK